MYRMLIVDDEPYIADSLIELMEATEYELDLYKAYNGRQALELIERKKMDIVLTDIEMPDLTGIELQTEIRKLWPDTPVLFLTGYNYFHYAQNALRGGGADYLLKTEGEAVILDALGKTIERLDKQKEREEALLSAKQHVHALLPMLQKEYMGQLLSGRPTTTDARAKSFQELSIPLAPDRPLLLVVGRVDEWEDGVGMSDRSLFLYAVQNIACEYLQPACRMQPIVTDHARFAWVLQLVEGTAGVRLQDVLDSIQSTCRRLLKLTISLVVGEEETPWEQAGNLYSRLVFALNHSIGMGKEMLLTTGGKLPDSRSDLQDRTGLNRMTLLEESLEKGDAETFMRSFREVGDLYVQEQDKAFHPYHYELYCRLVGLFFSYVNRWGFAGRQGAPGDFVEFMDIRSKSKEEIWNFLTAQFQWLLLARKEEQIKAGYEIVEQLNAYIDTRLGDDLSLQALSEVVHLNPYYLSRLYKQQTGRLLKSVIAEKRLARALHLLSATDLQIQEIAQRVGFESNAYFNRFIKKEMKMTPGEYRARTKKSRIRTDQGESHEDES